MSIFSRLFKRESEPLTPEIDPTLLQAILGNDEVTKEAAMSIPAVAACVNRIAETVAALEVKLYKKNGDSIEEVEDDTRVLLLNGDTKDTLTGYQLKEAMVRDMLLGKGGYAFINRKRGTVRSIHYVPCEKVSFYTNNDVIFKKYQILVDEQKYEGYQFIKLLRNSRNGYSGRSVIADSNVQFQISVAEQIYERKSALTGGIKKGFFKAQGRLEKEAMAAFRAAYKKMFVSGSESAMLLNEGIDFKEISESSRDLQLNENKNTNNNDICKIFGVPPSIINGGSSKEDRRMFYEGCIYPILTTFSKSLNDVLLNPWDGEGDLCFAFDDSGLTKADITERYIAYERGIKNGFLQLDDVRKRENLPALGIDFVKLGLQDVLYYPENGNIYTPNMAVMSNTHENVQSTKESEEKI